MPRTPQQAANEAVSSSRDVPSFQRVDTLLDHPQDADLPVTLSTLKLQEDNHRVSTIDSSHLKDLPKSTSRLDPAAVASATAAAIAAFTAGANQDTAAAGNTREAPSSGGLLTQSSRKSTLSVTVSPSVLTKSTSISPKKLSKLTVSVDAESEPLTRAVSVVLDSPLLQCHIESRSPSVRVIEPQSPPSTSVLSATTPGTSRRAPRSIFK